MSMNMDKESMDAMKARISELIETGKSKGVLTYKEIIEQLGDIELDPDQFNRILDTLSGLNIDVIKDDPVPDAAAIAETEEEEIDISVPGRHVHRRSGAHVFEGNRQSAAADARKRKSSWQCAWSEGDEDAKQKPARGESAPGRQRLQSAMSAAGCCFWT